MASRTPDKSREELQALLRHWREEVPDDRLAHLVTDVRRGMSRSLQLRLNEHAVAFGHWTFLRVLWQKDGLTQRELSERAGVMEPTTFTALKAMERMGYVVRRKLPDSRKNVYVFLTPFGQALRDMLVPQAIEVNEIAVRGVPPEDIDATRRTLLAMVANLAEDETRSAKAARRIASTQELRRRALAAEEAGPTLPQPPENAAPPSGRVRSVGEGEAQVLKDDEIATKSIYVAEEDRIA